MNNRKLSYKSHQPTNFTNDSSFRLRHQDENKPTNIQKTDSKGSLAIKRPLEDTINIPRHIDTKSKQKNNTDFTRAASIEYTRNPNNRSNSNINGTKWLNSERQVMQFIMNLKSKKSECKSIRQKRQSDCFQTQEKRTVREDLLCNKMLSIKKIQKYEKEAISSYYQKDYERCFGQLGKAESLIKRQNIDTPQHMLYINYLYAQFYFKLQQNDKWRNYILRAKTWINKISLIEVESMKEYILNVKALEICLAIHDEQYQKVLLFVDQLKKEEFLSSKIRKRLCFAQITACKKLYKYKEALKAIDEECLALEQDLEIDEEKKDEEFGKLVEMKVELTAQFYSTEKAIQLVETLINFEQVSAGITDTFSYYNCRVYELYNELINKQEKEQIKTIFFLQKWLEREHSEKEKLKIEQQLFSLYYDMGIYGRALDIFDQISSENVVYLGPQYLFKLANIKHVNGQENEAISIVAKIIDICEEEETRAWYMYKILQFDLQQESEHLREQREKMLEKILRNYNGNNRGQIMGLYVDYLTNRGQSDRATCLNKIKTRRHSNLHKLPEGKSDNKPKQRN